MISLCDCLIFAMISLIFVYGSSLIHSQYRFTVSVDLLIFFCGSTDLRLLIIDLHDDGIDLQDDLLDLHDDLLDLHNDVIAPHDDVIALHDDLPDNLPGCICVVLPLVEGQGELLP